MSEQDVQAPGWVDPHGGRRSETGATAVVPGQRTEGAPAGPAPEVTAGAAVAAPPAQQPVVQQPVVQQPVVQQQAAPQPPAQDPPAQDPPARQPAGPATAGPAATQHPTAPVDVGSRPRPRLPRRDPLIRMGPWAPVAGAAVGLLLGIVVVLFLAPAVETFDERLALVFVVLGTTLLGAGGTLLADEVRLLRRGAQAAEARASGAGVIAGLLNGLTPARLLITASAFSLLLSAYVTQGS
ncbi:hypothetical protein [Modestobacter versicolor]|uniref:hypothetical protein n=1 Tax=Modestobacter versicolor TaxID=429133 RepID=UPI0034DE2CA7